MSSSNSINKFVCRKIKEIRISQKIGLRELAYRAGIPVSSYASVETGAYRIHLDNLFRILGILEIDITDVWPTEAIGARTCNDELLYFKRLQEFRMNEVISLSEAEGGAFLALSDKKCRVLMRQDISDFLLDRLALYFESGQTYDQGVWWHKKIGKTTFHFFLKVSSCPNFVSQMVSHYIINWSALFYQELARNRSENS